MEAIEILRPPVSVPGSAGVLEVIEIIDAPVRAPLPHTPYRAKGALEGAFAHPKGAGQ